MMDKHYLAPLFAPSSIVVLTPQDDAPPQIAALQAALRAQSYSGALHFLDLKRSSGTLHDLAKSRADLAVLALPPQDLDEGMEAAVRMRCRAALALGSGVEAQQAARLQQMARRAGMHLLGPNSLGLQRPALGLNASTAGPLAQDGSLALVCQSGALTSATLDWAIANGVGFSSVVSLGPHTDVGLAEALDFLAHDPQTHSIAVCMEGIQNARRFMSALRSAAYSKPVVVLKAGRRSAGSAAALTHSASIVGDDDAFDAALRRAGAVRVRSFTELFSAAKCLGSRHRPVGRRLALITNGGGPGVLAADWACDIGLELGQLSEAGRASLAPLLPAQATLQELIDLSEEATPEHYRAALAATLDKSESQIDGVLALFAPKATTDADAIAQALADAKPGARKPLLTCWMGDATVGAAREILRSAGLPTFRTPESAVGAFGNIATYHQNQRLLQQVPPPLSSELARPDIESARLIIEGVLAERRHTLTEMESKALLAAFHIPVTRTLLARSSQEAMMIAAQLGFPVALKIDSPDISHKSDVGGVALNLSSGAAVRDAYEAMMQRVARLAPGAHLRGVTVQPMARAKNGLGAREVCIGLVQGEPFGPVITFGAGGSMIELIDDHAMELPPLNQFLARSLIERSRVAETLGEWRGAAAVDMQALEQVLLRVSEMVCALPQLRGMDINPLIVDEGGVMAVDARIVIGEACQPGRGGDPYGHLSILPYPERYEQSWPLRSGGEYLIRAIRPSDAHMLQRLVREMSPESRYMRFASRITEMPPAMLARFTLIDYDRDMALVAVLRESHASETGEISHSERIVGVSRYVINPDPASCEFALLVADDFASQGLGARLMHSIIAVARERGLSEVQGLVLVNNTKMLRLMRRLGFSIHSYPEDPGFKLVAYPL